MALHTRTMSQLILWSVLKTKRLVWKSLHGEHSGCREFRDEELGMQFHAGKDFLYLRPGVGRSVGKGSSIQPVSLGGGSMAEKDT